MADTTGGKAAAARAHWVGIVEAAHDRLAERIDARKADHVAGLLERFEADYVPTIMPLLAHVVDNPDVPEPIRALIGTLTNPEHFSQSILLGIALGSVISPVLQAATAPFVQSLANATWPANPVMPLAPDLLAASVIKGVLSEGQAASLAAQSGIDGPHFHTMVMTAGQSFGVGEALLLLRRGQIDRAEFDRIVHYSNTRNDFIPSILKLIYAPPPSGEVIAGALKQHLDPATAKVKLAEAGIDPSNFEWMLKTAGRPYGTQEALQLLNRGIINEARVRQVVAQSDVNPDFTNDILALRVYLPPPRSVVPMLRSGAITEARALQLLEQHGLSAQDAAAFVAEAHHTRTGAAKELSVSLVMRLYEARIIDGPTATARIVALGYTAQDASLYLRLADDQRHEKAVNATVSAFHTLYVNWKADATQVHNGLGAAGVPGAAINDYLNLWGLERQARVHHPTPAQVVGAYRRGEISAHDCKARLTALGVQPNDLGIIVADGYPPTHAADAQAAAAAVASA